jgi:phosphatidylglycerophosphate synthase
VTLLRAALVCLIGGTLGARGGPLGWSVPGLVALALALDGADGWLARRLRATSRFGARFDLEVDALFLLVLALLAWQAEQVGAWVIAIGLLRYAFVAAGWLWPVLRADLPPSLRRKAVCVLQGAALLACLLPPVAADLAAALAAAALAALALSFAIDVAWLIRRARPGGRGTLDRRRHRGIFQRKREVFRRRAWDLPAVARAPTSRGGPP